MKEAGADLANQEIAKIYNAERLDELDKPDDIIEVIDGLQDISDSYAQAEDMNKHMQNAFFKVLNEKQSEAREAAQDWLESAFAELDQQSQEIVDSMEQAAENLPEAPDQPVSVSEAVAYQNNLQEAINGGRSDMGVREAGLAAQVDNFRNHKGMRGDFLDKRDQIKRVQDGLRNADPDMRVPELQSKYRQAESKLDRTFNDVLYLAYEKANEQLSQADELIKQAFQKKMTDLRRQVDDLEESIQLEGPSLSELQSDLMQARQERKESWFGSDTKSDTEEEIEAKISQREEALSEARAEIDQLQNQAQELRSQAPEEFADKVRDLENSLTHKRNHLES
jgi:chromosome segregation ATPase